MSKAGGQTDSQLSESFVLLIAHGSRLDSANADLIQLAEMLRSRKIFAGVQHAYLELAEPSIPVGAKQCVEAGAKRVILLPYFLSEGRHVSRDLQDYCQSLNDSYPDTTFVLAPPLGLHPSLVDVLLDRVRQTV